VKRLLLAALLATGCATTTPAAKAPAGGETPEVPYQPAGRPAESSPPLETPAKGGEVAAVAPAEAAPPPKPTFDARTQTSFREGTECAGRGDLDGAERAFKSVIDQNSHADYAWTNLGMIYERRGDDSGAEKAYRRALDLKPDQEIAWDSLARLYCRTRRCNAMESEVRQKIAEQPAALGLRTALVYTLLQQNKFEPGAAEAKKVLKADERSVRAMQLLAQIYAREGKNELAKMVLENARAIDSNDAATHNALGMVYLALKQKPQALEAFQKACGLKPDFAEANNNYGAMLNESQDYDGAVKVLEMAVATAPDLVAAHLNLGNAYRVNHYIKI
jgi:Tfp pilus assembly protein PilF